MPKLDITTKAPTCPACRVEARFIDTAEIYGVTYGFAWVCVNFPRCDYRVGAHPDGLPLGAMADAALRQLRIRAHRAFDGWWRGVGLTRRDGYRALTHWYGSDAHISWMDAADCQRVIKHFTTLLVDEAGR